LTGEGELQFTIIFCKLRNGDKITNHDDDNAFYKISKSINISLANKELHDGSCGHNRSFSPALSPIGIKYGPFNPTNYWVRIKGNPTLLGWRKEADGSYCKYNLKDGSPVLDNGKPVKSNTMPTYHIDFRRRGKKKERGADALKIHFNKALMELAKKLPLGWVAVDEDGKRLYQKYPLKKSNGKELPDRTKPYIEQTDVRPEGDKTEYYHARSRLNTRLNSQFKKPMAMQTKDLLKQKALYLKHGILSDKAAYWEELWNVIKTQMGLTYISKSEATCKRIVTNAYLNSINSKLWDENERVCDEKVLELLTQLRGSTLSKSAKSWSELWSLLKPYTSMSKEDAEKIIESHQGDNDSLLDEIYDESVDRRRRLVPQFPGWNGRRLAQRLKDTEDAMSA